MSTNYVTVDYDELVAQLDHVCDNDQRNDILEALGLETPKVDCDITMTMSLTLTFSSVPVSDQDYAEEDLLNHVGEAWVNEGMIDQAETITVDDWNIDEVSPV